VYRDRRRLPDHVHDRLRLLARQLLHGRRRTYLRDQEGEGLELRGGQRMCERPLLRGRRLLRQRVQRRRLRCLLDRSRRAVERDLRAPSEHARLPRIDGRL
jgi:hypothetical protein